MSSKHHNFKLINNKLKSIEAGVNSFVYELKIKEQVINNDEFRNSILSIIKPQEYKRRVAKKESKEIDFNNLVTKAEKALIDLKMYLKMQRVENSEKYIKRFTDLITAINKILK